MEKVKLAAISENEEENQKPKVMSVICSSNDYQGGCSIVLLDRNGETAEVA